VHVVQVYRVGTEPPQARVDAAHQGASRRAMRSGRRREPPLRGDDRIVDASACRRPSPDDALGLAVGVDIGRVDQRAAGVDERVELTMRVGLVGLDAERHRAEREPGHDRPAAAQVGGREGRSTRAGRVAHAS